MSRENPTETPSSLTSSTVPINNRLPQTWQAATSTWEPIGNPKKPIEVDPSQVSLGDTIDDRRDRLPPVPLFPSVDADLPPDYGLDDSDDPQPVEEVRRRHEPAMVDNKNRVIRMYGPPGAQSSPNTAKEVRKSRELIMMVGSEHWDNSHEMD